MHIPEKYYKRIPQFCFIVGILLLANSVYLGIDNFAAYVYMAFGFVVLLYAVGVQRAREPQRNYPEFTDGQETLSETEAESEVRELS